MFFICKIPSESEVLEIIKSIYPNFSIHDAKYDIKYFLLYEYIIALHYYQEALNEKNPKNILSKCQYLFSKYPHFDFGFKVLMYFFLEIGIKQKFDNIDEVNKMYEMFNKYFKTGEYCNFVITCVMKYLIRNEFSEYNIIFIRLSHRVTRDAKNHNIDQKLIETLQSKFKDNILKSVEYAREKQIMLAIIRCLKLLSDPTIENDSLKGELYQSLIKIYLYDLNIEELAIKYYKESKEKKFLIPDKKLVEILEEKITQS